VEILSRTFAATALDAKNDGIALFAHPDRDCIYQEEIGERSDQPAAPSAVARPGPRDDSRRPVGHELIRVREHLQRNAEVS